MKLITSKGDSSSLKILIASEFSNTNVDLVFLEQQCSKLFQNYFAIQIKYKSKVMF